MVGEFLRVPTGLLSCLDLVLVGTEFTVAVFGYRRFASTVNVDELVDRLLECNC